MGWRNLSRNFIIFIIGVVVLLESESLQLQLQRKQGFFCIVFCNIKVCLSCTQMIA